jgi:hypothetical protein
MHLELHRVDGDTAGTRGSLFVNGALECCTLEDTVRLGKKVPKETAIPAGTYPLILNVSPKYGKVMPRLLDVPNFDGILIHPGNTEEDTWGCILVGLSFDGSGHITGGTSTTAFNALFAKLRAAHMRQEPIDITVTNDFME